MKRADDTRSTARRELDTVTVQIPLAALSGLVQAPLPRFVWSDSDVAFLRARYSATGTGSRAAPVVDATGEPGDGVDRVLALGARALEQEDAEVNTTRSAPGVDARRCAWVPRDRAGAAGAIIALVAGLLHVVTGWARRTRPLR